MRALRAKDETMKANLRSVSGALLMLLIIPIFAGLLACMPVPIGDPERSRVDPWFSGYWIMDDAGDVCCLYLMSPWDKRTMVITGIAIDVDTKNGDEAAEVESTEAFIALLRARTDDSLVVEESTIYKAWITKLARRPFMTWQNVGVTRDEGNFMPEYWWVWQYEKVGDDTLLLRMIDSSHDAFEDIVKPEDYDGEDYHIAMRRAWEKAIRKHINDDGVLSEDAVRMRRLPSDLTETAEELFGEIIAFE